MKPKAIKREEAEKRSAVYESLTPKQKLERLNKGKFRAAKERKRLGFPEIPSDCVR
jgi:Spy/CpxP family protein refolding chaperone